MRFPIVPLLLIGLPLVEIALFIVVGGWIGVLPTIALVIATTVAGSILLRVQGLGLLQRIRAETEAGRTPGRELVHGAMIVVAALLLLLPGFLTDFLGLLLFVPFLRDLIWSAIGRQAVVVTRFDMRGGRPGRNGGRGPVIDLDADDYSSKTDPGSPWRRIDRDS